MPQVDKATLYPIILWTLTIVSVGYLFLFMNDMYHFVNQSKLQLKRAQQKLMKATALRRTAVTILAYPWISI